MKQPLLLLPGAWHGTWCFEPLLPHLASYPILQLSPHFPCLDLNQKIEACLQLLQTQTQPVTLVAHSMGGLLATALGQLRPNNIEHIVYISAFIPKNKQCMFDLCQALTDSNIAEQMLICKHSKTVRLKPELKTAQCLYSMSSLELQQIALSKLHPERLASFRTRVKVSENFFNLNKSYIACANDRVIPQKIQQDMILNASISEVYTLDCDHSPFFSCPISLAKTIKKIASKSVRLSE